MEIMLPQSAAQVIEILEKNGFEAWAVGGCVRDSLLGQTPKDWDIATNALPEQTSVLVPRLYGRSDRRKARNGHGRFTGTAR